MTDRRLISVCITTFNQDAYIAKCLESVLDQEVDADIEVLIGDDCSDDGTSQIISQFASHASISLTHIRNPSRLGPSENMINVLQQARGDFIARLDGDDFWLPHKLQIQLDFLNRENDCVAVYANAVTVNRHDRPTGLFNDLGDCQLDLSQLLRHGNVLNNSSPLYRRKLMSAWIELTPPILDYQVHLLHARQGKLAHLSRPLVAYRVDSQGSLVAGSKVTVRNLYWQAIESIPEDLVSRKDRALGIADFYRRVIFQSVRARSLSLTLEWWPRIVEASPYGRLRTGTLVLGSCIRMAAKELVGLVNTGAGGPRPRVLYRY